jgi:hypothetical protein
LLFIYLIDMNNVIPFGLYMYFTSKSIWIVIYIFN